MLEVSEEERKMAHQDNTSGKRGLDLEKLRLL
jgi:hypothetical protein